MAVLPNCTTPKNQLLVSVKEQKMTLLDEEGRQVASYPISTSKFGLGDQRGSNRTPLGKLEIARKIGDGAPIGAVFKSRRFTGEVIPVDAPGRDPIVTRILWLKGTEGQNQNAYGRYIYIHGTPEERNIGRPASFGCIRMRSQDVVDLYERVGVGTEVVITTKGLPKADPPKAPEAEEPPVEMLDPMAPPASLDESERKPLFASVTSRFRRSSPASPPSEATGPETLSTDVPPEPAPTGGERGQRRHGKAKPVTGPPAPAPEPAPAPQTADASAPEHDGQASRSSWHLSRDKAIRLLMSQNHHAPVDSAP